MATKNPKIADFRDRILLANIDFTVDSELNRIEKIVPIKEVWANIEAKSSNDEPTETGERPTIKYKVVIRKTSTPFGYVYWKGQRYTKLSPQYDIENKYTCFEMSVIYVEENFPASLP